jgi:hypothetical protein
MGEVHVSFPYLVAIASWPLIALGFAVAIVAQRRSATSVSPSAYFLTYILIGLPVLLMFDNRYQSELNLFVQDLTLIPGGGLVCWGGTYLWRNADILDRKSSLILNSKVSAIVCVTMGIALTTYGTVSLSGDFLMERREVAGVVTKKYVRNDYRFGNTYYVEIEGRQFPATADMYTQIQPLSHVHATVGRGTGNIFTTKN